MAFAVAADAPFAAVLVLAALANIAGTAQKPAQAALMPQLARTPLELAAANVCWSTLESAGFVGGSLLVAVLVAVASLEAAFAALGVAFLLTAVFAQTLPRDHPPPPIETDTAEELVRGFRTVAQHPELRLLVGIFTFDAFVQSMMDVLIIIAALELLDIGQSGAGWLNACWGIGGIIGAGVATALLGRDRLAWGLFAGCVLAGIPFALIGVIAGAGVSDRFDARARRRLRADRDRDAHAHPAARRGRRARARLRGGGDAVRGRHGAGRPRRRAARRAARRALGDRHHGARAARRSR